LFRIQTRSDKPPPVSNPNPSIKNEYKSSNVNTKFDVDVDVFDLCGGTFKKELSTNISKAIKSNALDVYVTGPFNNLKTGKKPFRSDIWIFSQRLAIEGFISWWIPTHLGKQDEFYEKNPKLIHVTVRPILRST
jgi:hypothetical protein